ncbi:deaminase [Pseudomonas sp. P8_250]|uniref:deaminase n=1 Tax=Pseudomonas sp. P8_250 TaxID=3043446 RepID=UPI002A36BCEB|nr:deaminase [Pseudomonas sp. P8_250]MDX9668668.1 deaminase [Pseudomonas sp. P8_250]
MKPKHMRAYMDCAHAFARCSVGERLKVGAVIVKGNRIISCGYNALPEHLHGPLEDCDNKTKPEVRHSEKNALMGLVRSSESAVGATMFCTHSSCYFCAVDIVDAGIKRFVFRHFYRTAEGLIHLLKAGVEVLLQHGNEFTQLTLDDFIQHIEQGNLNASD